MKVILRQNIDALGQVGDIIEVNEGYALNYLIPKKYAYAALKGNLRAIEDEKKLLLKRREKEVAAANELASNIENVKIEIMVQAGEEDKLFGSVTSQMIADKLKEKGFELDKRSIELHEPIKALGIFDVPVKLHSAVTAKIKVFVVKEQND
ncbi:MAG: 50S ribosomal protein L9 [Ignavibacteriales bacterium]|nr:MAG: 50S ribosomal protein L9 [Ignavibacteriaceae bacterium]MBW7873888.1 50S ribosomal protein L9 [Ignavibacteria bacterium]MCZ2143353.1 50S ribosomal protein L9 [Ignavibacteriales bacterium]MBV6444234.1 50S ribosomal protein L9 [Ignavibacteriaceae bacterium]MBZ0197975.1 50S ribosomal protein L9 [Ignavibacteriaceae bacterium]